MSELITIPNCHSPFIVTVNGERYVYPAGETMEVPDHVAHVIRNHHHELLPASDVSKSFKVSWNDLTDKPFCKNADNTIRILDCVSNEDQTGSASGWEYTSGVLCELDFLPKVVSLNIRGSAKTCGLMQSDYNEWISTEDVSSSGAVARVHVRESNGRYALQVLSHSAGNIGTVTGIAYIEKLDIDVLPMDRIIAQVKAELGL